VESRSDAGGGLDADRLGRHILRDREDGLHLRAERDMEKLLLTVEESAEVLGISRTKVFALIASGAVRSVMIGGSRRVVADGLREYVSRLSMELARYGQ